MAMKKNVLLILVSFLILCSCEKDKCPEDEECPNIINLKDGLLAYYPFSGDAGDSSGNNNHGIIVGGLVFTSDRNGKSNAAAEFDGVDDYIIANETGNLSPENITISAYYNTSSTEIQNLLCKRQQYNTSTPETYGGLSWSVNARSGVYSGFNNAQFGVPVNTGSCNSPEGINSDDLVYSLQTINPSQWYHIVCIFENGSQRMYINGKIREATVRNFNSLKQCPGGKLVIGAFVQDFPAFFKGKMDEIRIYGRALNEEEIKELAK
jgi:Concanavalin A-like lectin/glucanases superfamily